MTFSLSTLPKASGRLSLIALAVLASTCAWSADAGWYAGANIGQSQASIDDARIAAALLGNGLATSSISDINRDLGYKIFGGYQLNKNFAIEGGYVNLGKFGFVANTVPMGTLTGEIELHGINLDLVGTLPITERFSVLGRIGAAYLQTNDSFTGTGAVVPRNPSPTSRDTNLKVGLGLQYAMSDAMSLRAEIERYRINDAVGNMGDVDLVSVGLIYRFGAKAPPPMVRQPAPEPVVIAQAPAPVIILTPAPPPPPAPAPAPRVPQKLTLSADSVFDFDNASVKPAGRQELDKFAADLKGVTYDVIQVTGHTDRIGTHAYNQKLSERRAQAVSTYLVESAGIPASKINAQGVDGANPVTQAGDCPGKKVTQALISCLQPDRRVDIEVSGSR